MRTIPLALKSLCILLCLGAATMHAQSIVDHGDVPRIFSYQGLLTGPGGIAVPDGEYELTVSLYADPTGSLMIWRETSRASVAGGVFNLLLGSGTPLPDPATMSRPLWIGARIGDAPEMYPLSPLSAAPYALNVPDRAITTGKLADGAVTIDKMGLDYIGGITVNGQTISGRGMVLNIEGGPEIALSYDAATGSLTIGAAKGTEKATAGDNEKGTGVQDATDASNNWKGRTSAASPLLFLAPVGSFNTLAGGASNTIGSESDYSAIVGGHSNDIAASANYNFIGGGERNYIDAFWSVIAGGDSNTVEGANSGILAGSGNVITGNNSAIAAGGAWNTPNTIDGDESFIGAGTGNLIEWVGSRNVIGSGSYNVIGEGAAQSMIGNGTDNAINDNAEYGFIGNGLENRITNNIIDGFIGNGEYNTVSADYGFIGSGTNNTVSGTYGAIPGGDSNTAQGKYTVVAGGTSNDAANDYAIIGGGKNNTANDDYAIVVGGENNRASNLYAVVGGGLNNEASGMNAFVGNGLQNLAPGAYSATVGGINNNAGGGHSFVGGGWNHQAFGQFATIAGGRDNQAAGYAAFVGAGGYNVASTDYTTVSGGAFNRASAVYSVVSGGWRNIASGMYSTVGGGDTNITAGQYTTISGGRNNIIGPNIYSTIGGGYNNVISGGYAVISGGDDNRASATDAVVGGGWGNWASGLFSTVGGGKGNFSAGRYSAIPGGDSLLTTSYAQSAVGFYNAPRGALTSAPPTPILARTDDPLFIVGNGSAAVLGGPVTRSNAFEVSYNGHSVVYDRNGTGALRVPIRGATYSDNIIYAWGDIDGTGAVLGDFGVVAVTKPPGLGVYIITVAVNDPQTGAPLTLTAGAVTATLVNGSAPAPCGTIICSRIGVPGANQFQVNTYGLDCTPADRPFMFHLTGRP